MEYLTTAKAGANWGISARRVAILASQGRIPGAMYTGKCWLIPGNAAKPEDSRTKESKAKKHGSDRYVYPFIICCVHSEEQISQFTEEEAKLYQLCLTFESGDLKTALQQAESLLSSENIFIRIGALYHLPFIHMNLGNYAETDRYSVLFKAAAHSVKDHKAELRLLISAFDSELSKASLMVEEPDTIDIRSLPYDHLPIAAVHKLFSDILRFQKRKTVPDIFSHELICEMVQTQGYYFFAMYMHVYLSYYYGAIQETEKELWHLRQAVDIGLEHGTVFSVAAVLSYNPVSTAKVLNEHSPEAVETFRRFAELYSKARSGYAEHRGSSTSLFRLSEDDYRLISYCMKNYSIEQMAEALGLSRSGTNRRLSRLYSKLCVRSKNEMIRVFTDSILDWGET